jgi:chromosome segregation and condensation protein ScpB
MLIEANKPEPVYRGKRSAITGSEVEGIMADLKAKGLASKWRRPR